MGQASGIAYHGLVTRSGERCERAGVYESTCDDGTRIALMEGSRFPTCRRHGHVAWALLESQPPPAPTPAPKTVPVRSEPDWKTSSGERCRNTGVYESLCADTIKIALMKGSRFPTCGNHGDVDWVLVKERRF